MPLNKTYKSNKLYLSLTNEEYFQRSGECIEFALERAKFIFIIKIIDNNIIIKNNISGEESINNLKIKDSKQFEIIKKTIEKEIENLHLWVKIIFTHFNKIFTMESQIYAKIDDSWLEKYRDELKKTY
tara:strand:- start:163 stop:546 length:384 start_codon:yes stop_codon:yes gene_type:complete